MSLEDPTSEPDSRLRDLPTFDLAFEFDDADDPSRVTVYSERDDDVGTRWLTVDVDAAVDLRDVA